MSIRRHKNGHELDMAALARHRQSTADYKLGYHQAIADCKVWDEDDNYKLAMALLKRDRVRNTWENLPVATQAKYLSDAIALATSMGFTLIEDNQVGHSS